VPKVVHHQQAITGTFRPAGICHQRRPWNFVAASTVQDVRGSGTGLCWQRADHLGGEHVVTDLRRHRMLKEQVNSSRMLSQM
jgi:hypothetical protein